MEQRVQNIRGSLNKGNFFISLIKHAHIVRKEQLLTILMQSFHARFEEQEVRDQSSPETVFEQCVISGRAYCTFWYYAKAKNKSQGP